MSGDFDVGASVRVKPGVTAPEFPDVSCAGWTGRVAERVGKKADPKYVVAWDEATLAALPPGYRERCEQKSLLFEMSCFAADELDPAE
ncbi:MAG TPA: hypothetical protein VML55_08485 [Planctomycetaceae bacterium]|nr:hypothetical protein [Planctomycetaceae bacterium]